MASSSSSGAPAGTDGLDQLLDSALDDFTSLDLSASSAAPKSGDEASGSVSASGGKGPVKGLGMGLPDPKAPRRCPATQTPPQPRAAYASDTLEQLTQETREAVRSLEMATGGMAGLDDDAMIEEFVKQFEEFAGPQMNLLLEGKMLDFFWEKVAMFCGSFVDLEQDDHSMSPLVSINCGSQLAKQNVICCLAV